MNKKTWSINQLKESVQSSKSIRQVLKKIGLVEAGGNYAQIKKFIKKYAISTEHFVGQAWNKGLKGYTKKPNISFKEILVIGSNFQSYKLKRRLINAGLKKEVCEICGWAKMALDGRIPLELDHINGKRNDNRLENLRILCPNCHSLQPTHRGLNKKIR